MIITSSEPVCWVENLKEITIPYHSKIRVDVSQQRDLVPKTNRHLHYYIRVFPAEFIDRIDLCSLDHCKGRCSSLVLILFLVQISSDTIFTCILTAPTETSEDPDE